ncbi:MAG: hypothetical protein IJ223_02490 [Clostridia bacterium]|nr:hypothetical protein [Clostridia bacterium]
MDEPKNKLNNVSVGQMGVDEEENFYFGLHPMMPRKYNAVQRAKLREFERELLTDSKDKNVKVKINLEEDIER